MHPRKPAQQQPARRPIEVQQQQSGFSEFQFRGVTPPPQAQMGAPSGRSAPARQLYQVTLVRP